MENILVPIITAIISSLATYLVTKKNADSKIEQIRIQAKSDLEKIQLKHQHEIEKIQSDHQNEIEKLNLSHDLEKDSKSNEFVNKIVEKFITGGLDLDSISSQMSKLTKLQKEVERQKNNSKTSNFINHKKRN